MEFAHDAIRFFQDLTIGDGFVFDITSDMDDLNSEKLIINNSLHKVTWALPETFIAPTYEWYQRSKRNFF